jgi:hypothetical protein
MEAATGASRYLDRPLVYVATPHSTSDPLESTLHAIRIVDELIDEELVTPVAPHLALLWHLARPRPFEFWYAYELATLVRCDAVYCVAGESPDVERQAAVASDFGIPVFHDRDALSQWASRRLRGD